MDLRPERSLYRLKGEKLEVAVVATEGDALRCHQWEKTTFHSPLDLFESFRPASISANPRQLILSSRCLSFKKRAQGATRRQADPDDDDKNASPKWGKPNYPRRSEARALIRLREA